MLQKKLFQRFVYLCLFLMTTFGTILATDMPFTNFLFSLESIAREKYFDNSSFLTNKARVTRSFLSFYFLLKYSLGVTNSACTKASFMNLSDIMSGKMPPISGNIKMHMIVAKLPVGWISVDTKRQHCESFDRLGKLVNIIAPKVHVQDFTYHQKILMPLKGRFLGLSSLHTGFRSLVFLGGSKKDMPSVQEIWTRLDFIKLGYKEMVECESSNCIRCNRSSLRNSLDTLLQQLLCVYANEHMLPNLEKNVLMNRNDLCPNPYFLLSKAHLSTAPDLEPAVAYNNKNTNHALQIRLKQILVKPGTLIKAGEPIYLYQRIYSLKSGYWEVPTLVALNTYDCFVLWVKKTKYYNDSGDKDSLKIPFVYSFDKNGPLMLLYKFSSRKLTEDEQKAQVKKLNDLLGFECGKNKMTTTFSPILYSKKNYSLLEQVATILHDQYIQDSRSNK